MTKRKPKPVVDGIFLCIGQVPVLGPFDTWKDADLCCKYFGKFHPSPRVLNVRKFRRGIWLVQPR